MIAQVILTWKGMLMIIAIVVVVIGGIQIWLKISKT